MYRSVRGFLGAAALDLASLSTSPPFSLEFVCLPSHQRRPALLALVLVVAADATAGCGVGVDRNHGFAAALYLRGLTVPGLAQEL